MKKYILMLFIALLYSCGFHPRGVSTGDGVNNFDSVVGTKFYIESNDFDQYANELRKTLISYKANMVTNDKDADYIINIQDAAKTSQMTSVVGGASNNTYQLIYTVTYNIVKPNDETPIVPNKTLSTQQFWQSNSGTVLAQDNEASRIYNYLQDQLATNMVNQIALFLPEQDNNSSNATTTSNKSQQNTSSSNKNLEPNMLSN
ncbi:hypothetical protein IB642_07405 [Allofrancisella guangzhouensis]|uniref:LPS-assembly lipoprotein LptE n=2 Tax=Pseudomonadota TaxID=1224 RepID=UPI00068DE2B2|nr:LPS assembly lipoprotein LptE [Allofrancisella guangzhouensis]MBK2027854.1 hypothetical protein [Allofrancisella guangzhouensis]MBK2044841.1 hypothetical protein [Allofrancisella guangzhouensis]MBK2046301.1 hypothetical protein [Allofrancisella guangzhouensis]